MLQASEQLIIDRLIGDSRLSEALRIIPFPNRPPDDAADVRGDAVCFVRFAGLSFDSPAGGNRSAFIQSGTAQFELHYLIRDLRDHRGAYGLMEIANELLSGLLLPTDNGYSFTLPGLHLRIQEPIGHIKKSSVWHWIQGYEAGIVYTQEMV